MKDGPFRFWFNRDFEGVAGNYHEGREVGKWQECDRFERCQQTEHPLLYPIEEQRAETRAEVPVTFEKGKYTFDFQSCWSTLVTHLSDGKPDFDLIFATSPDGCGVEYSPVDRATWEKEHFGCKIPFQVGRRSLDSLDLRTELSKAGLPQYCAKPGVRTGPYMLSVHPDRGEGAAQIFTAEFSLGNNSVGIAQARLHFQERAESRSNRCVARYDPASKSLFLLSDQPGKYLGPMAAGGASSLWNSRCLLAGCSTAEVTNDTLKVRFAIRFNPVEFAGEHNMFLEMVDTNRQASPASEYGQWTVPSETGSAPSQWPSDRSCPVPMLGRPIGYWTSVPVNCADTSGKWSDPENGGTWTLSQTGAEITGSLTIPKGSCGSITWQVNGKMNGGIATLTATQPSPSMDKCGVAADHSLTIARTPYCNTTR